MIPPFDDDTGNLPPGQHLASWTDVATRFGWNKRRRTLLEGLLRACQNLKSTGARRVWVDGSFVTDKENPSDYDGCWDRTEMREAQKLDPVLQDMTNKRAAQKAKYFGELFQVRAIADALGRPFVDFFQCDRDGNPKGIVIIDLETVP